MIELRRLVRRNVWAMAALGLLVGGIWPSQTLFAQSAGQAETPPAANGDESAVSQPDAENGPADPLSDVLRRLAADRAVTVAAAKPDEDEVAPPEKTCEPLRFSFSAQPWGDCLEWLADKADFSLVADHPPPGTCNYVDNRGYTPEEAIDVFNRLLLVKGYSLVRRDRMLWLLNLEDPIPPKLLPTLTPEELDGRGEFELVNVIFQLETVTPEEVESEIQPLLSPYANPIRLEQSRQLWLTETAGRLRTIRGVIESMDGTANDAPQFKTYLIARTNATTLQTLLKTMLEDAPDVKLSLDPTSGNLIALAPGEKHEVIRDLLVQLGESGKTVDGRLAARNNLRVVPLSGSDQENALRAIRQVYGSRLRIVTPSAVAPPAVQQPAPGGDASPAADTESGFQFRRSPLNRGRVIVPRQPRQDESRDPMARATSPGASTTAAADSHRLPLTLVLQTEEQPRAEAENADPANDDADVVPVDEPRAAADSPNPGFDASPSDVLPSDPGLTVATTPRGIVVHSDDLDLLDEVEALIRSFAGAGDAGAEHTFFFLRNATAKAAAETIKGIIGSGSGGGENAGGELLAANVYTGPPQINADERLNALIVKASPTDLNRIEELLQVIDQDGSPETHISPRPRVIPVVYADVEAIETIVKATFEPDIFTNNTSRDRGRGGREDFFARMRGGGDDGDRDRGGNGNGDNANDRNKKMTVTSDKINNALIVSAPQALYEEVLQLVEMLDVGTPATNKTARVVTLHRTNAQSVQGALSAMFGGSVTARTAEASEESSRNSSGNDSRSDDRQRNDDERRREEFRRRMEFFQRFRGGGDRGGDRDRGRGGR